MARISVLIPTYKRAHLLKHVLEALRNQTYKKFEVVVILKPSGDKTEDLVEEYKNHMDLKVIPQHDGYFLGALNLGLDNAAGDIISFLDDDAIPAPDWIQTQIETLDFPNTGGVAGNVIPVTISKGKVVLPKGETSETIPNLRARGTLAEAFGKKLWNKPLTNMEDYLVYLSKAGVVSKNRDVARSGRTRVVKSLLEMGANMCVRSKAIQGFRFPDSCILGSGGEQLMGWHIWKQGYRLMYNPKITVFHVSHGQTLSRSITQKRKEILRSTEANLLFYRLYDKEPELSIMHRISWLTFDSVIQLKRICINREIYRISRLISKCYSETIGAKWILYKKMGLEYSPLAELRKLQ